MSFAFLNTCKPVWRKAEKQPATEKWCRRCGDRKALTEFYLTGSTGVDGTPLRRSHCKACESAKNNLRQKAQRRG
ncbi:MAG TPA: hypothetical protein VHN11_04910 [Xanthobacteraceae bacterium]|jgi:hypothetical protein|nr:hypothetical protein [Xanthobacteraceae bacterium]